MERLDYIIAMLERTLKTRSKRHIMGGALISASLLFGGLALTVMTLKTDIREEYDENELQDY
jgi:hypothetical protein